MKALIKNICPRCKELMEVRGHMVITEKMLRQPYYFTEWYFCPHCSFVQLFEDKKVFNKNI